MLSSSSRLAVLFLLAVVGFACIHLRPSSERIIWLVLRFGHPCANGMIDLLSTFVSNVDHVLRLRFLKVITEQLVNQSFILFVPFWGGSDDRRYWD
jgi:hypothetical protein